MDGMYPITETISIRLNTYIIKTGENTRLNVGIIGAGGIAHASYDLPQMAEIDNISVTHTLPACKPSRLRLLSRAVSWGFRIGLRTTGKFSLTMPLMGVVIALPHPLHVPVGLEALAAGKHVLMQKPLCCGDMDEANEFVSAVEAGDRCVLALPKLRPGRACAARAIVESGGIGHVSLERTAV